MEILQAILLIVSIVGGIIAIFGAIIAICTYRSNSRLKRAEWLYSLYEKFYEQDHYKEARRIIDYETPEIQEIRTGIEEGGHEELVELVVDYLNFFEFIASLWRLKQVSLDEVKMVFEYYLLRVTDFDFLMDFIKEEGFENLATLIFEIRREREGL